MYPWTPLVDTGRTALVLIRHGRTAYNHQRRFLGRTDLPLDEEGVRQVSALSRWTGAFDAVMSSPLARATMTADVLGPIDATVPDFAELDHGSLEGLLAEEAMERHPLFFEEWRRDPGTATVPGGGRLDEARDAALVALEAIAHAHRGEAVAVVGHQLVWSSVIATLDGAPLARWRDYALANAGAALIGADGERLWVEERLLG